MFGAMILVGVIVSIIMIPARLNEKSKPITLICETDESALESSGELSESISSASSEYK